MKNRVLIVGPLPPPAGGMQSILKILSELKFENYELKFFNTTKSEIIRKFTLINYFHFLYKSIFYFVKLFSFNPKIVHIHTASNKSFWQSLVYFKIAKLLNKKTIIQIHGGSFVDFYSMAKRDKQNLIRNVLDKCDLVVVLSNNWKNVIKTITSNRVLVIENAVYLPNKLVKNHKGKIIRILFLGRVTKQKGIFDIINAAKKFNNKVEFIIGGEITSEEKREIELKSKDVNNIKFVGEISGKQLDSVLRYSDIFILPSYAEALPMSILEAMSYGLPIIASNVGAIPEIISRNNGILIKPGDVNSLVSAIQKLLNKRHLMENIGRNNRRKIQRTYGVRMFKNKINTLYGQVIR